MNRYGVAAALIAAACVLAGCGDLKPSSTDPDQAVSSAWTEYPAAFPVSNAWLSGPQVLVSYGECFIAVGTDSTGSGRTSASWTAEGDCTKPDLAKTEGQTGGDALPSKHRGTLLAAAPAGDGEFVAVGRTVYDGDAYAFSGFALRGQPGAWRHVAQFDSILDFKTGHTGPSVLTARPGGGFLAPGRREDKAVVWASEDGSKWTEAQLPTPAGLKGAEVRTAFTGPGGQILIGGMGYTGPLVFDTVPLVWVSADRGNTWQTAAIPDTIQGGRINTVVHDGRRFLALGAVYKQGAKQTAYALSSLDGNMWKRESSLEPAGAYGYEAAVGTPDFQVYAAAWSGSHTSKEGAQADKACASVWSLSEKDATQEKIGCHGVPTSLTALQDGRFAAVHWSTLWLRRAA